MYKKYIYKYVFIYVHLFIYLNYVTVLECISIFRKKYSHFFITKDFKVFRDDLKNEQFSIISTSIFKPLDLESVNVYYRETQTATYH